MINKRDVAGTSYIIAVFSTIRSKLGGGNVLKAFFFSPPERFQKRYENYYRCSQLRSALSVARRCNDRFIILYIYIIVCFPAALYV